MCGSKKNQSQGKPQVLVFGSVYQGATLVHVFEPLPCVGDTELVRLVSLGCPWLPSKPTEEYPQKMHPHVFDILAARCFWVLVAGGCRRLQACVLVFPGHPLKVYEGMRWVESQHGQVLLLSSVRRICSSSPTRLRRASGLSCYKPCGGYSPGSFKHWRVGFCFLPCLGSGCHGHPVDQFESGTAMNPETVWGDQSGT